MAELILKKEISDFIKRLSKHISRDSLKYIHIENGYLYMTNGKILIKHNIGGRIPDGNYVLDGIEKESTLFKVLKFTKINNIEYPKPEHVIPNKTDEFTSFRFFKNDSQNLSLAIVRLFQCYNCVFNSFYIKMVSLLDTDLTLYTRDKNNSRFSAVRMGNDKTTIALMLIPRF